MGPKKKKAGKKTESAEPLMLDGQSTAEMTKEQIEDYSKQLIAEKDRANEERNYFQLERDQIATFWQITQQMFEETKAKLRSIEGDMEEDEESHQVEVKIYKQKVKHLLYEHENNIVHLKAMSAVALKLAEEDFDRKVSVLKKDKRSLLVQLKEQELSESDVKKSMIREKDKTITNIMLEYQRNLDEHLKKYEKKLQELRKELNLKRKTEIHEIEERKNAHIQTLMKHHEQSFTQVKSYYNDITMNNLALIHSLKKEIEQMKKKEELLEVHITELSSENKKLVDPLQRAQGELQELKKQLANYTMDKLSLQRAKDKISIQNKDLKRLYYEEELNRQICDQIKSERDQIMKSFQKSLEEIQQKSGLKNLILEQKLEKLTELLEVKDSQFNELLASSNLDEKSLSIVNRKIEEVLGLKNTAIKDLRFEVARIAKSHNDLINTYTAHLQSIGIPKEDIGFEPLQPCNKKQQLGKGVAGLVSKPHLKK